MVNTKHASEEEDGLLSDKPQLGTLQREQKRVRILSIIAAFELVALIVVAFLVLFASRASSHHPTTDTRGGFPPAESSLRFKWQIFDKYGVRHSPTAQEPGPGLDAAWHDLLSGMMFRVSAEELQSQASEASIALADGSGYVASLGVYHELHCVKLLKHWLHKDHYLAGWEDEKVEQYWKHLNHCTDWLKDAALCRSDTTLTTLAWNQTASGERILDTEYPVEYRCVEPQSLFKWVSERAVDVTKPDVLVAPE